MSSLTRCLVLVSSATALLGCASTRAPGDDMGGATDAPSSMGSGPSGGVIPGMTSPGDPGSGARDAGAGQEPASPPTPVGEIDCPSLNDYCRAICNDEPRPELGPHCAIPRCDCSMAYPVSRCDLPLDPGPCEAAIPRFFFDAQSDSCEPFTYGGCEGNENNFVTKTACESFCQGLYSAEQSCAQGTPVDPALTCDGVIAKDLCFAELIDACTCLECEDDCSIRDGGHARCVP